MKEKDAAAILNRIAADFTELARLMQDEPKKKKEQPAKEDAAVKDTEPKTAPAAETKTEPAEDINFEDIRSTLAEKAANGCRQQVKDLLKEYSLSCLSDIASHPELFADILKKARAM